MSLGLEIILTPHVSFVWLTLAWALTNANIGDNVDVYHWSVIEITTAIICACLPALRVLLGRFVPGVFGTPQTRANSTPLAASRQFDRSGHNRIEDCESSEKSIVGDPKENVSPASYSNLSPKSLEGSEGTELVDMMHGRALEQLYGKD